MIVKKIKAKANLVKGKASHIKDLTDYIRDPEQTNPKEKVLYSNGRGFLCDDHPSQQAEMVALASEAVRSQNPVAHYVMSWHEGEQPSPEQVEEAVSLFLDELGLKDHQAIYALHKDTDNIHLHLAVNRVHPETLKVIKPNKGFDIEAAHKAIARIEHAQGWQREQNGRYALLENGELGREQPAQDKPRQPSQPRRDMEQRTGEKSAERIAIEEGAPIMKKATSWQELHSQLATKGMRYEKTGSGATLFVGDVGVKASSADREASLGKLQKRLGVYEPPPPKQQKEQQAAERKPEPIKENVSGWETYITGRKAHYAVKEKATLEQRKKQDAERQRLAKEQKARRDEILGGRWKGKGQLLNTMKSVLAAEQAADKAELQEKHNQERKQLQQQYRPYPDLEQWQRQQHNPTLADQWRYRASEPQRIEGHTTEPPTPRDIRAYTPEVHGQEVHYTRKENEGAGRGVSFVDKGRQIEINEWRDRGSVLAALQLSAQKWGSFKVNGNDEYKAICASLAAQHGFKIDNPELQESIQKEREKIQQERAVAMQEDFRAREKIPKQLTQFEKYHEAVNAERYRVTSIKMHTDGSKKTFILDKQNGETKGFTPQEIEQRTPEMQRLQRRGENLYYTPLSATKHHILIDDMDRSKLERLIKDGYQPATVLESSPGNYQAIITLPKLGTPHDKDVGNRLAEFLNKEYGDPKLSGAIHPHRAPGYENRKPKHRREDGSYPEVRLLKAERRECVKTLALSSQIDAEYQRLASEGPQHKEPTPRAAVEVAAATGSTLDAYQRHSQDVLQRQKGGKVDLSRVDAMVAVRMRVTGHSQADIEAALRQCAPTLREKPEGRDWNDYAQRTARYAFGAAGDRQAADLGKYRQQWERLEGREPPREKNRNLLMAESFAKEPPAEAVKKYPELAGAYAAVAAIDKKAEADGLDANQRAVVTAKVREQIASGIQRGEIPKTKIREETVKIKDKGMSL
jgi:hypothetical protein